MSPAPGEAGPAVHDERAAPTAATAQGRRSWIGRGLALAAVAGAIGLLGYGLLSKAPNDAIDQRLAEGEPAPAPGFGLAVLQEGRLPPGLERQIGPAMADGRVALSELRGTPVVLNFWASWCVPCREEARLLARSWQRYGREGVLFVGLNMQDITTDAERFMREFGNTYLNVRDPTDATAREWGVTGIPETFFVTPAGNVVSHVIGVVSEDQMRAGVAATRAGSAVSPLSGGAQRPTR
jgi:cytochrome c biogenesis protein CcmG, thiol:disulfide interchange protein DsbE